MVFLYKNPHGFNYFDKIYSPNFYCPGYSDNFLMFHIKIRGKYISLISSVSPLISFFLFNPYFNMSGVLYNFFNYWFSG